MLSYMDLQCYQMPAQYWPKAFFNQIQYLALVEFVKGWEQSPGAIKLKNSFRYVLISVRANFSPIFLRSEVIFEGVILKCLAYSSVSCIREVLTEDSALLPLREWRMSAFTQGLVLCSIIFPKSGWRKLFLAWNLVFPSLLSWKMRLEGLNFIPERSEGIKKSRKSHFPTK